MLDRIYRIYRDWTAGMPFVCRKGCAVCCTQSVTMTSGEGRLIIDFLQKNNRLQKLAAMLDATRSAARQEAGRPAMTTNQFAARCLAQLELPSDEARPWNFAACIFLEDDCCAIYPVRPFGCRSFGSLQPCEADGVATLPATLLAANTVLLQVIEHLDRDGGLWGTMNAVLAHLLNQEEDAGASLLPARSLPGFLLDPAEARSVAPLLARLRAEVFAGLPGNGPD